MEQTGAGLAEEDKHTVNTEGQAQWARIDFGPLARVAGQAGRVPVGKRESEWSHVTQGPPSAELEVRVKMRGRRGKVSRGPERGSGRPAGHASALQIDGSHRIHSQRSLVRGKEEAWSGPLAGSCTGLQVSSLARASAVHRQPGRQPGGPRIAPGKVPEQQQATRVRPQSARKEHNTAGFQVPATRSQCASDPGSGPGGQTSQATTRKGLMPQTSVTMAVHPSISPHTY